MQNRSSGSSSWIPALAMTAVSTLSYIDRNALAVLIPSIQKETGLSAQDYGWIVAAFSYAYMAGNPVWGMILDRLGVRRGMLLAAGGWTIASALHAFAGSFGLFALLRTVLGFFEGATFPGGVRTVVQTLRPSEHARGVALSYSGGSLGAVITPFVVTPIAVLYGWRAAFLATGVLGVFWLLWWLRLSAQPQLRGVANTIANTPSVGRQFSWRDPRLFGFVAVYALGALPIAFILYMSSIYLSKVFGLSQATLGTVLWIPPLGWECGYFFWGWALDRGLPAARVFLICFLLSLPFGLAGHAPGLALFLVQLFLQMFLAGGFIVGGIAYAKSCFGDGQAGLLAGLGAGSYSLFTALTAPLFGGFLDRGLYPQSFYVASVFPVVGYAVWVAIHRRTLHVVP
ncbi:MAG: MFS transporter [Bryobacter sp.]|nr:MFS transporter [Bryobacter sp.]